MKFQHSDLQTRLAAPHQLQNKPDADDLVFGKHFTDHMLKIAYHKKLGGWQRPEIMPMENLVLHPAAKVFHYALEVSVFLSLLVGEFPRIFKSYDFDNNVAFVDLRHSKTNNKFRLNAVVELFTVVGGHQFTSTDK